MKQVPFVSEGKTFKRVKVHIYLVCKTHVLKSASCICRFLSPHMAPYPATMFIQLHE